ncbi:hypothetical protein KCP78_24390 [Salmonella enterica subsp. enterica]|nr:hypothetical protein KCP78_24390 [Salmonella enterica subsp. enterica]
MDFTRPEGTLTHLAFCRQHGKGMRLVLPVLTTPVNALIREASQEIAIVLFAANLASALTSRSPLRKRRR